MVGLAPPWASSAIEPYRCFLGANEEALIDAGNGSYVATSCTPARAWSAVAIVAFFWWAFVVTVVHRSWTAMCSRVSVDHERTAEYRGSTMRKYFNLFVVMAPTVTVLVVRTGQYVWAAPLANLAPAFAAPLQFLGLCLISVASVGFTVVHCNMGDSCESPSPTSSSEMRGHKFLPKAKLTSLPLSSSPKGSPVPEVKPEMELIQTGLFAFARHPMYVCFVWFWIGASFASLDWLFSMTSAIFVLYLLRRIPLEEEILLSQFGNEYAEYKSRVPMLGPGSSCWIEHIVLTLFGAHVGEGETSRLLGKREADQQ